MTSGTRVRRAGCRAFGEQEGSVSVLAAGCVALVCVLSLVAVDISRALAAKARAQTAADATALAAAQEIALGLASGPDVAREYAERIGATLVQCTCPQVGSSAVVEVEVPVQLVFLRSGRTVRGEARAVIGDGSEAPPTPSAPSDVERAGRSP